MRKKEEAEIAVSEAFSSAVIRNNWRHGLHARFGTEVSLIGGTISGNAGHGVLAGTSFDHASGQSKGGGKVIVYPRRGHETPPQDGPQTVSAGNGGHDWATVRGGETDEMGYRTSGTGAIEGLAESIPVVALEITTAY